MRETERRGSHTVKKGKSIATTSIVLDVSFMPLAEARPLAGFTS